MISAPYTLNANLRTVIIAAVSAFEAEMGPARDLTSTDTRWKDLGLRAQMAGRFDGRRNMPSLPLSRLGWRGARRRMLG
jgi:hypothetical protein